MLESPKENIAKKEVLAVTQASTRIKEIITNCVRLGIDPTEQLGEAINECLREIKTKAEREKYRVSLIASARRWYYEYSQSCQILMTNLNNFLQKNVTQKGYSIDPMGLLTGTPGKNIESIRPYLEGTKHVITPVIEEYRKKYQNVLRAMAAEPPKVVSYTTAKGKPVAYDMSLRNRAEMTVRYEANMNDLAKLRDSEVKLVWISTHPNCSPRCQHYQGKLYSLDGTSGVKDGNRYQPIEIALRGPNGDGNGCIDGYNCRHRTVPYQKGSKPPSDYTKAEIKKAYAIDANQRRYENNIRCMKTQEKLLRASGDSTGAQVMKRKWRRATKNYEIYSIQQGRAFYRWRCAIEEGEET